MHVIWASTPRSKGYPVEFALVLRELLVRLVFHSLELRQPLPPRVGPLRVRPKYPEVVDVRQVEMDLLAVLQSPVENNAMGERLGA